MSLIPPDIIERVKEAVDLVELVGRYVKLKKAGKEWKACCPFHQEKTPSFGVVPSKGFFKCFGCGASGNCFGFLQQKEGLTFPEAVKRLAKEVGIEIEPEDPEAQRRSARNSRLREVCELASRFYAAALRSRHGQGALAYLHDRGITDETIERFQLGWAPPGWRTTANALAKKGVTEQELVDAGLVVVKDGRDEGYDRFRDRVIFPIADRRGRVIAFGARALGDAKPKYLNSPETPLFTKGRHLYALHLAKDEMRRGREGAVMEGYTDVLMAHQDGWPVAVAGLGTALTTRQAEELARHVDRVHLVYDGDAAGLRAAEKAIGQFLPADAETRVVLLPQGADPADVFLADGIDGFRKHLEAGEEAFAFLIRARREAHGGAESAAAISQVVQEVAEALVEVDDPIRRSIYCTQLADALRVELELIREQVDLVRRRSASRRTISARPTPPPPPASSGANAVPDDGPPADAYAHLAHDDEFVDPAYDEGPAVAYASAEEPPPVARDPLADAGTVPRAELLLLQAALGEPRLLPELRERLPPDALTHAVARELYQRLLYQGPSEGESLDVWGERLDHPALVELLAAVQKRRVWKELLRQGRDSARELRQRFDTYRHEQDLQQADEVGLQDEVLRAMLEHHRRRAAPPPPPDEEEA